jgi:hypothetical protein
LMLRMPIHTFRLLRLKSSVQEWLLVKFLWSFPIKTYFSRSLNTRFMQFSRMASPLDFRNLCRFWRARLLEPPGYEASTCTESEMCINYSRINWQWS